MSHNGGRATGVGSVVSDGVGVGSAGDGVGPTDGDGEPPDGDGDGGGDGVAVGAGDRVAVGRGDAVAVGPADWVAVGDEDPDPAGVDGVALVPGLDGSTVGAEGDSEGAALAAPAPGVGNASGRSAAPMAIAATSDGTMANAMKMVERVWFIGLPPRIARPFAAAR